MPIYDFKCLDCDNEFEITKHITDDTPTECPKCNSINTKKLISKTSFILKGTGWYATDNRPKNNN